jgi:hypothetical protein
MPLPTISFQFRLPIAIAIAIEINAMELACTSAHFPRENSANLGGCDGPLSAAVAFGNSAPDSAVDMGVRRAALSGSQFGRAFLMRRAASGAALLRFPRRLH